MLFYSNLPNQLPGEQPIKIVRKSFFVFFKKLVFSIFLVFLPALLLYVLTLANQNVLYGELSWPLLVLGGSIYILFMWLLLFFFFLDYYLDVWVITNKRIINIEQNGFFSRTISEQGINRVQDVTSEVKGAWHTILNYGDLYVQTAGEIERFAFNDVPNPDKLRDIIISLAAKGRREEGRL